MGKKRGKNRKYLFLHGARLLAVLLLSTGCVATLNSQKKWQGDKHLDLAEKLVNKGEYEGALKKYEEVVRLFPGSSPGDNALFHMGLIWAHPDNPQRNYRKTLQCFRRLLRDFPQSTLRAEVSAWVGAINEIFRCWGRIKDLEETVSVLKKRDNALKEIDIGIEKIKRGDLPEK